MIGNKYELKRNEKELLEIEKRSRKIFECSVC